MAKINDRKKLFVIHELYQLRDVTGAQFFAPEELSAFRMEFGEENKKTGIGRVKVTADIYMSPSFYKYVFYGYYYHTCDYVEFKSVEINCEFSCTLLLPITQDENDIFKIERRWDLEEEEEGGDADAVPVTACPVVVTAVDTLPQPNSVSVGENCVSLKNSTL